MAQLSTNVIKIVLYSLTYQKVPKTSCENYMYILIQNRKENILFIASINIKTNLNTNYTPLSYFSLPNLGRKLNEIIPNFHKNYLNDKNIA